MPPEDPILTALHKLIDLQQQHLEGQRTAIAMQQTAIENQQKAIRHQLAIGRIYRISLLILFTIIAAAIYWALTTK